MKAMRFNNVDKLLGFEEKMYGPVDFGRFREREREIDDIIQEE